MIGRLLAGADFERVLGTPPRARSPHFAVHHLADGPSPRGPSTPTKLSTGTAPEWIGTVDESPAALTGLWVGTVVPKRHARRSVTRSLLKRQIRRSIETREEALSAGLWVIRLRAPFDPRQFASASSSALRQAASVELEAVLARVVAGPPSR